MKKVYVQSITLLLIVVLPLISGCQKEEEIIEVTTAPVAISYDKTALKAAYQKGETVTLNVKLLAYGDAVSCVVDKSYSTNPQSSTEHERITFTSPQQEIDYKLNYTVENTLTSGSSVYFTFMLWYKDPENPSQNVGKMVQEKLMLNVE